MSFNLVFEASTLELKESDADTQEPVFLKTLVETIAQTETTETQETIVQTEIETADTQETIVQTET